MPRGFITQNGWNANVASNHGLASRGHLDYPGRVWFWQINVGALYPPEGCRLQFDNGTIWGRPHWFPDATKGNLLRTPGRAQKPIPDE